MSSKFLTRTLFLSLKNCSFAFFLIFPGVIKHIPVFRCAEDYLVLICCGLYDLLRGVLLILPDIMLEDVMDKLIQPDYLIVLVNHPSPLIQQGVIKVGLISNVFS